MNGLDVEEFIMSQKVKITEEKARLANRGTGGILPSDSIALERSSRLRKERQSEYQDYIKRRDHNKRTVAEMRTELSREREAELSQRKDKLDSSSTRLGSNADDSYDAFQGKKLTEERLYRGDPHCLAKPRKHNVADEDGLRQDHLFNNEFACKISDAGQSTWDEEEKDLMQWTRNKGHSFKAQPGKENMPPGFDSTHVNEANSSTMLRSISVPIAPTAVPLPGWSGNDSHVQKIKKIKYAEDLRNQIREKKASVKYNEALHRAADQHLSYSHLSRARAARSVADDPPKGTCSILHHKDYSDRVCECVQKPTMATRSRDNSKQDYPFYNQPPPSFQGHPGVPWITPMYPYPNYYDCESNPEMYRHPYYYPHPPHSYPPPPGAVNPYSVPPSHHHHDSRKHSPLRGPGRREEHHDHNKRNYSPPSPLRRENNEWGGSPSWRRERDKDPKIRYREELEKQMREKKEREMKENMAKESLDKKREIEIYDPFGKGGCGAPVRDQHGNLVADLKQMRKINENRLGNNSLKPNNSAEGEDSDISWSSLPKKASHVILTYDKRTDEDIKKSTQVNYRDFLCQQVKEKEELRKKEKERQRNEEKKELEHLERDRKRIQEEYQREIDIQKIKVEQARKKNEAILLEAEVERQRILMQQEQEVIQEKQEKQEQRSFARTELVEKLSYPQADLSYCTFRSTSPPIPTLRRQMNAVPSVSTADPKPQNHFPSNFSGNPSYQPASSHRLHKPPSPDHTKHKIEAEVERQIVLMQREQEVVLEKQEQRSFERKELVKKLSYPQADLSHCTFRSTSPPIPTLRRQMNAVPSVSTADPKPQNDPSNLSGNLSYQPASRHRLRKPSSPDPTKQKIDHSSPPVPTLRRKKTNPSNSELESSKANSRASLLLNPHASSAVASTQIYGQVLDGTRAGVRGNHSSQLRVNPQIQVHTLDVHESVRSHRCNGTNAVGDVRSLSSRRQLSALDSEEILAKLGAIRMHLQEELDRQNCESHSQSDIFERAKRHEPRIAAPLKSNNGVTVQTIGDFNKLKYSSSTQQGEFLEMNSVVPRSENTLTEQQGVLLRHQQDLRKARMNVEKQKGNKNHVDKDSCGSREGNTLLPEFSRSVGYPFGNKNDSLSLTSIHDRANLLGDFSHISHCQVYPDIDGSGMAIRNEERIKRLEALLNSGTYSKPPPLGARGYSSGSLEHRKEKGDRRLTHIHRVSNSVLRHCPSRQSERSLECETQHLPA